MAKYIVATLMLLTITGCAHRPNVDSLDAPGFLMGILHGFLAPWALVGSIFMDIRIYAFPNSGGFYEFGFLLGLSSYGGAAVK